MLDGQLLDGLVFCAHAYDAFEQIRSGPRGVEELRLLSSQRSKKMIEEILPLARYVQSQYGPGRKLSVRWLGGSQSYDAYMRNAGAAVKPLGLPARQYLEVTTAVQPNEYLVREHINSNGVAFASRGTRRDPKTRVITSEPTVYTNREPWDELVQLILSRIENKARKRYPKPTSLIVRCVVEMPVLDDEWSYVVDELRKREASDQFREVVLIEHVGNRCTVLYNRRPKGTVQIHR